MFARAAAEPEPGGRRGGAGRRAPAGDDRRRVPGRLPERPVLSGMKGGMGEAVSHQNAHNSDVTCAGQVLMSLFRFVVAGETICAHEHQIYLKAFHTGQAVDYNREFRICYKHHVEGEVQSTSCCDRFEKRCEGNGHLPPISHRMCVGH